MLTSLVWSVVADAKQEPQEKFDRRSDILQSEYLTDKPYNRVLDTETHTMVFKEITY